jgi:hypothetical protein
MSVNKLKKHEKPRLVANSLRWIGIALLMTSVIIFVAKPSNITIFIAPYIGNKILLSKILSILGCLSTATGYIHGKVSFQ